MFRIVGGYVLDIFLVCVVYLVGAVWVVVLICLDKRWVFFEYIVVVVGQLICQKWYIFDTFGSADGIVWIYL